MAGASGSEERSVTVQKGIFGEKGPMPASSGRWELEGRSRHSTLSWMSLESEMFSTLKTRGDQPVSPPLGLHPKDMETGEQGGACSPEFIQFY